MIHDITTPSGGPQPSVRLLALGQSGRQIVDSPDAAGLVDGLLDGVGNLYAELESARWRAQQAETHSDHVYCERAHAYALVTSLLAEIPDATPAALSYNSESDPQDWPVLYLELPRDGGQLCYHVNPRDLPLFDHVEVVPADDPRARWDHAGKDAHHDRIRRFVAAPERTDR
ncbi:hypothetical protein [Nocardia sp. NPDC051570]|uniref:hypothetical protein n=1 Tax=Nocardia sp. NPDC051570 TaxID=3364324 RepID=UPI0037A1D417